MLVAPPATVCVQAAKTAPRYATVPLFVMLAFRNLFYDRVRFAATLVGVVMSVVLVTVQIGLYVSCERMITAMIDRAEADLWIVPVNTKSFENTDVLEGHERLKALATEGVRDARPLVTGYAKWSRPDGASTPVIVVGIDPEAPALLPWNMVEGGVGDLAIPNGVIVDRSYLDSLGISAVGEHGEIADAKARVVALSNRIRSFTTSPYVFTTLQRARRFLGAGADSSTYYLVRLLPGTAAGRARATVAGQLSRAEVLTPAEFRARSLAQWLYRTGAGAALLGGAILGIIVGTVIIGQTLYASTKEHINEFATLRAVGSSAFYLNRVILCQAFLSALIGFTIAAGLSLIIVWATVDAAVPVVMTPILTGTLFALTLLMCSVSSVSAIIQVMRIDPVMAFTR
jgi:putative ABC transport system permease protein